MERERRVLPDPVSGRDDKMGQVERRAPLMFAVVPLRVLYPSELMPARERVLGALLVFDHELQIALSAGDVWKLDPRDAGHDLVSRPSSQVSSSCSARKALRIPLSIGL